MHSKLVKLLPTALLAVLTVIPFVFATPSQTLNLPESEMYTVADDEADMPDVTARVARVSYIDGDAQIRRLDSQDWEKITLNLPIVEGDEITTSLGSRVEIQFNSKTHLRLTANSYLRILKLKDEGIAISLPEGSLSVRLVDFDKERSYFEIDAPNTTIAAQRSGMYRLDAGKQGDDEIRVTVLDKGEARVYSDMSGFTIKSGRSSRIFISGNNAGEWETGDASRYADDFDTWALQRDVVITEQLKTAYYDKYYDQDIYGAEELTANGEWINTNKYGYVWRPYRSATSRYTAWSPYRYGHWRWVPPFGWTWVNDEPWGWATYHYGRWFYDDGYWNWSPYGYYRYSRSWWQPALVIFTSWGGNYCWYPLPYSYAYYNYNYYYFNSHHGGHHGNGHNNGNPTPSPTPDPRGIKVRQTPIEIVPVTGVITVKTDKFGIKNSGATVLDATLAKSLLTRIPDIKQNAPILPEYGQVKNNLGVDIKTARPQLAVKVDGIKTGAAVRKTDTPLDNELRTTRNLGGRPPVKTVDPVRTDSGLQPSTIRQTGGVDRSTERTSQPVKQAPTYNPPSYTPPTTRSETVREPIRQAPVYNPPPRQRDPEPVRQPPVRNDPPPRQRDPEPVRQPPKETPKPQPKADPPPAKSGSVDRKKDGR
ncbi:MAG: DUF6600 domain-containing protein [Pyrinomonadaceae bacterium]